MKRALIALGEWGSVRIIVKDCHAGIRFGGPPLPRSARAWAPRRLYLMSIDFVSRPTQQQRRIARSSQLTAFSSAATSTPLEPAAGACAVAYAAAADKKEADTESCELSQVFVGACGPVAWRCWCLRDASLAPAG